MTQPPTLPHPLRALLIGSLAPLGKPGVESGIFKQPVSRPLIVRRDGLAGDAQGDRKHHGGPEKALHHYAFDHYARWRAERPQLAPCFAREGAFGENISTLGLTEADVCIGDIYRLGSALLQVSQARQPCWRLNLRFGDDDMARRVQDSGRTGWYYRVLEEGRIAPGDGLRLVERPAEGWPLARILRILYHDSLNRDSLAGLATLPHLTPSWRRLARQRLERGAVEDWSGRLNYAPESPASLIPACPARHFPQ